MSAINMELRIIRLFAASIGCWRHLQLSSNGDRCTKPDETLTLLYNLHGFNIQVFALFFLKSYTTFPHHSTDIKDIKTPKYGLNAVLVRPRDAGLEGLAEVKLLTPPEPLARPTMP